MRDYRSSVEKRMCLDVTAFPLHYFHHFNFLLKSGTLTSMMLGKSSTSTIVWITFSDILIVVMGLKIKNVWTPDVIENGTQVF